MCFTFVLRDELYYFCDENGSNLLGWNLKETDAGTNVRRVREDPNSPSMKERRSGFLYNKKKPKELPALGVEIPEKKENRERKYSNRLPLNKLRGNIE